MQTIGIIGCGGKIGFDICRFLSEDFYIKGGQRHEPESMKELKNFSWTYLDVYDKENLIEFCNGCSAVVNCAGPAYIISKSIAEAALISGATYIDVSDALAVNDDFLNEYSDKGRFVIASGYYPGLIGMLIRKITEHFDRTDHICGYSGGDEEFTAISCIDIALSGESGKAVSNGYWKNGCFHKTGEVIKFDYCDVVGREVYIKQFISNELAVLLEEVSIGELKWFDLSASNIAGMAAMKYYQMRDKYQISELIAKLKDSINKLSDNRDVHEWNVLDITASGEKNGEYKKLHFRMELGGTYGLTSFIVAETVKAVLQLDDTKGIMWANTIIPYSVIEKYSLIDDEFTFTLEEESEI